jgi:dipeptidyl aminopeptidase/acylaminoacyl peptidase
LSRLIIGAPNLTRKEIRYNNGRNLEEISPVHNIFQGAPPTIIFKGTADKAFRIREAQRFYEEIINMGIRVKFFYMKDANMASFIMTTGPIRISFQLWKQRKGF